jgi:hypothetical protein
MGWMAFVVSMALLAGCEGSPTSPRDVSLGESFDLAPAQAALVGGTGLHVSFERVAADSRCAEDVTCVWEGDAAVLVTAAQPSRDTARFELHTSGSRGSREARYGDFVITMVDLRPQPRSTSPIEAGAYRVTLRVTR